VFKIVKDISENGNHITEKLSIADLIQIGGAAAVEYTGGPFINVKYIILLIIKDRKKKQ
jgi:hypothetical protein